MKFFNIFDQNNGELNDSSSFKSHYCVKILTQADKLNLNYSINFLLKLKDHKIPNNIRPADWSGCDLFGAWLAILTDSNSVKHYYSFISVNLPEQFKELCNDLNHFTYQVDSKKSNSNIEPINTDSMVSFYIENFLKEAIIPPPIKTRVKFNPPEIKPDN